MTLGQALHIIQNVLHLSYVGPSVDPTKHIYEDLAGNPYYVAADLAALSDARRAIEVNRLRAEQNVYYGRPPVP